MGRANGSRECAPDETLRETHQSIARRDDGFRCALPILRRCAFAISRHVLPEVCLKLSALSKERAQGRPGARRTRGLVCNFAQKSTHTSIQVRREHPGLPCAMALRLTSCSSRRTALLPPSPARRFRFPTDLTPAPRRQNHTTSPYASGA